MPTKLALKIEKGRFVVVSKDQPDLEEAKKMWMAGKSAQYIFEQAKRKRQKK